MKKFSWSLILALITIACQVQDDPMVLSEDAASAQGDPTTAASYGNAFTFSADGKTLTITINNADGNAKDVSHLNFKFTGCDGDALSVANITGITGNGVDYMGKLGSTEGNGNDCFGLLDDPFVKLDQGFDGFPVVVVIEFNEPVSAGQLLIKAGSSKSQTGGGCFGLGLASYMFSRDCTPPPTCYDEDSAWGAGQRYVMRGNWATYTQYVANGSATSMPVRTKMLVPSPCQLTPVEM